jgi:hypothetical protein
MPLSCYEGIRSRGYKRLTALIITNGIFAFLVVFAWTFMEWYVAAPISWATWVPINRGPKPQLLEYPFLLLWATPSFGIVAALLANKFGRRRTAFAMAMMPIVMFGLTFGWYYLAPPEWH